MQQLQETSGTTPDPRANTLTATVIVPTYRRTGQLLDCLSALEHQTAPPSQVIVVVRADDPETRAALEASSHGAQLVHVVRPGQTFALNTALREARGDVVAFTDDDAVPAPDWLERLMEHYADPRVGGVGGKVIVPRQTAANSSDGLLVGTVSPLGRPLGNHHLGDGDPRDVQWLKGVNMSYRRELCGFDESLRGTGAQVANDSDVALRVRAAGWRIVFDPRAAVDHFAGPRFDEDRRGTKSLTAMSDAVFNEMFVLMRRLEPASRVRAAAYLFAAGVPRGPGPLGAVKAVAQRRMTVREAFTTCRHATAARIAALRSAQAAREVPDDTPRPL